MLYGLLLLLPKNMKVVSHLLSHQFNIQKDRWNVPFSIPRLLIFIIFLLLLFLYEFLIRILFGWRRDFIFPKIIFEKASNDTLDAVCL